MTGGATVVVVVAGGAPAGGALAGATGVPMTGSLAVLPALLVASTSTW